MDGRVITTCVFSVCTRLGVTDRVKIRVSVRKLYRVARFLAAKYGRLLSIPDVRQAQCDAISCVCVCLFRSVVTMAVSLATSEIFSVKEWPDLEMWVWGCSRSLKMARFDRPCMTFY